MWVLPRITVDWWKGLKEIERNEIRKQVGYTKIPDEILDILRIGYVTGFIKANTK